MNTPKKSQNANDSKQKGNTKNMSTENDALEDDGTPVLDEADLAENHITVEEAENIEWEDAGASDFEDEEDSTRKK